MGTKFGDVDRVLQIAVTRAMREMGQAIFMKSQANVPVRTGELKGSGRIVNITGGFKIRYVRKYAARREYGIEAGRVIKVPRHRVGGFIGPMGRRVGGFMRGPFSYRTTKEEGSHYLRNAVEEELPNLGRRIARHLKMLTK
ncbi:hypothetical protein LCGC14_2871320 [marine sediment metagenome]|uniref:HK97 gp10 family phage protein n=1 Tax=marine sediment metagenome TaxID=412755 RepID=A0A0F8YPJ3_9ZZZZ